MHPSKPITPRNNKMRKVKHNVEMTDSSDLFAEAVESLIRDPLFNPSKGDQEEMAKMQRAARRPNSSGNLFNGLLRQLWNL